MTGIDTIEGLIDEKLRFHYDVFYINDRGEREVEAYGDEYAEGLIIQHRWSGTVD